MKKTTRKPDRQAVARSLRELGILFGKKPPDRNDNAHGQVGAGVTGTHGRNSK